MDPDKRNCGTIVVPMLRNVGMDRAQLFSKAGKYPTQRSN